MNRTKQNKKETQIKQINKINGWIQPEIRSIVSNCWLPIMIFPIYRIWGSQLCDFWLGGETKDARSEIDTFHDSLLSFFLLWWHFFFFFGGGRVSCRGFFPSCSENEVRMKSPINRQRTVKNPPEGYHHVTVLIFLFSLYHYHLVGFLFLFVSFAGIVDCYVWDFPPPFFFSLSFLLSCFLSERWSRLVFFSFSDRRKERERERENCFGRLIESSQESNALLTCIDRRS